MNNKKSSTELRTLLRSIDHRSYPAYKAMAGVWMFPGFLLVIDHVQGDPFAAPSSLHVEIENARAGISGRFLREGLYEDRHSRIFSQDSLPHSLSATILRPRAREKAVFCL